MDKGLAFWIIFLVGLVVGLWYRRGDAASIFLLVLVFLLGWAVFGFPIR